MRNNEPQLIYRGQCAQVAAICMVQELSVYLYLAGGLNSQRHGVLPPASFSAIYLQKNVAALIIADLITANKLLSEIKRLHPTILLVRPSTVVNPVYLAYSYASSGKTSYGETGYISGIYLPGGVPSRSML